MAKSAHHLYILFPENLEMVVARFEWRNTGKGFGATDLSHWIAQIFKGPSHRSGGLLHPGPDLQLRELRRNKNVEASVNKNESRLQQLHF
jgi:hypothetical protein